MKIETIFQTSNNKLFFDKIENVFDFERLLNDKLFLQYPKNSNLGYGVLRTNYFSDRIEPYKGYTISDVTINILYKYRKALYDYVYKSKRQVITFSVFYDIMKGLIIDDLRHDKFEEKFKLHTKEKPIKEKLNIWFSLYNYFETSNQKIINMTNNIEKHRELVTEVAEGKRNIVEDEEFAFVAGQVVYYLLSKSKSADKSYAGLEPFLQKSNYTEFRKSLSLTFNMYKHEYYSARFRNPFANVLDYIPKTNFKELIPTFLAGFFSENEPFAQDNTKEMELEDENS